MGKFQIVGTEQPLKNSPNPTAPGPGKNGTFQMIGDTVPLKQEPGNQPIGSTKSGEFELVGSTVKLDSTPTVGWPGYESLTSQRVKDNK